MGEVGKGYKFISSGKVGTWIKVKYKNKTGYVYYILLATHPPFDKIAIIKANEEDINRVSQACIIIHKRSRSSRSCIRRSAKAQ